jgi:dTDP-4-dehydrorhamnose reductase
MTRWLVTGAAGMLGTEVVLALSGEDVTAMTRASLDITDAEAMKDAVSGHDVVVNCAAWTDVDGAESHEDEATRVNGIGPRRLAEACAASGARLVHVSTDYVFDGVATTPYAEDAPLAPRCAYGRSKAVGEEAVRDLLPGSSYVVRTAWLYGAHGGNFVRTMMNLEASRDVLDVVDDQRGQPTWAGDVAASVVALVRAHAPTGTYHATSGGDTTWFGLARAVFEEVGADPDRVRPTTTDKFPRPAVRPSYSVLGHDAWRASGVAPIGPWRERLAAAFPQLQAVP